MTLRSGRSHIAANELELCAALLAEFPKEMQQSFYPVFRTAPQKPFCPGVELINQSQVLVPFEYGNFINADLGYTLNISVGKTVIDNKLDGPKNRVPTGLENFGSLLPGQSFRPSGQKNLIRECRSFLAKSDSTLIPWTGQLTRRGA